MSSAEQIETAEKALLQSQKRLSLALAASRIGLWEWDARTCAVCASPECLEITGIEDSNPTPQSFVEILHSEDRDRVLSLARRALEDQAVFTVEFRTIRSDGDVRWLFIQGKGEYDEEAQPVCLAGTVQDITDRKRTEEQLQSSVRMWNNTFDAMNDAISVMDEKGTVQRCNRAMIELTKKYPESDFEHPSRKDVRDQGLTYPGSPFFRMLKSRQRESVTVRHGDRWFTITADPIIDLSGELSGGVRIISDVTGYKQFEERLRESEGKFKTLAEQSLVGTYIVQDDLFRYVNERFSDMFGYRVEDIVDRMGPQDLVAPADRHLVAPGVWQPAAGESRTLHFEFKGEKRNGETLSVELFGARSVYRGRPATIGVFLDTTEKTKLEQQLRHAQKMEAVGQLTSGIAHDFNNLLSALIGYASLLQLKMKKDDPARTYADEILVSTDRAATLIRSLLAFSRKQIADFRPIDVNDVIRSVEKLLHWIIGEDIRLSAALAPGQLPVNADPGQLEQVLMNLATNAADAMPRGGALCIETAIVNRDASERPAETASERYVRISVSDTGVGMEEKVREKIFEPFFTTKDMGRGTGLGLSMVYGIIRQHSGTIHCYSEPGEGTSFTIYLPLLSSADGAVAEAGTAAEPGLDRLQGAETVLLAEDDQVMLSFMKTTLETFGYRVIGASDGDEALQHFLLHKNQIRMVISDVVMPGMSGAELRKAVSEADPHMPVLLMSGYPADIVYRKSRLDKDVEIMSKPFSPQVLLKRIREMLDGELTR